MLGVALSGVIMDNLECGVDCVPDHASKLVDRDPAAAADVQYLAVRRVAREQLPVRGHDILDVSEIPRLLAVAVDHRRLAVQTA